MFGVSSQMEERLRFGKSRWTAMPTETSLVFESWGTLFNPIASGLCVVVYAQVALYVVNRNFRRLDYDATVDSDRRFG